MAGDEHRRTAVRRLLPGARPALLAAVAAVVVVVGSGMAQSDPPRALDAGGGALAALAALALAWSPRAPLPSLAAVTASAAVYLAAGYPYGPVQLCLVAAVFIAGRRATLRQSAWACGLAALVVAIAIQPRLAGSGGLRFAEVAAAAWAAAWLLVPWSLGALQRARAGARRLREERAVADAVWAERMRLARDVHDVAGHGFALVALQAGVALLTLDERPAQARTSLEAIRSTSTAALADLRSSLATFGGGPPTGGSPRPGERGRTGTATPAAAAPPHPAPPPAGDLRTRLTQLVAGMRSAGVHVDLDVDPLLDRADRAPAPRTVEVVHRVVQESLTNVVRHAAAAPATVRVELLGPHVVVAVHDQGTTGELAAVPGPPAGSGVAGMRDRVAALGGALTAGPDPGGGFTVRARLPLVPAGPVPDGPAPSR